METSLQPVDSQLCNFDLFVPRGTSPHHGLGRIFVRTPCRTAPRASRYRGYSASSIACSLLRTLLCSHCPQITSTIAQVRGWKQFGALLRPGGTTRPQPECNESPSKRKSSLDAWEQTNFPPSRISRASFILLPDLSWQKLFPSTHAGHARASSFRMFCDRFCRICVLRNL